MADNWGLEGGFGTEIDDQPKCSSLREDVDVDVDVDEDHFGCSNNIGCFLNYSH